MRFGGGEEEVRVRRGRKREEQKRHFRVENKASRALCADFEFFFFKSQKVWRKESNIKSENCLAGEFFIGYLCLNLFYRYDCC